MTDLKKFNLEHFEYMESSKTLVRNIKYIKSMLRGKVLDIGCAKGFVGQFVDGEYHGVDITKKFASFVKNFKCVDISREPLPFPSNSFDSVLIFSVLEHVDNFLFVIKEAKRVMKVGGKLIIIVPNPRHIMYNGIIFRRFQLTQEEQHPHIHSFTEEDLRNLLFINKLKPLKIERVNNTIFGKKLPEWRPLKLFAEGLLAIAKK